MLSQVSQTFICGKKPGVATPAHLIAQEFDGISRLRPVTS